MNTILFDIVSILRFHISKNDPIQVMSLISHYIAIPFMIYPDLSEV